MPVPPGRGRRYTYPIARSERFKMQRDPNGAINPPLRREGRPLPMKNRWVNQPIAIRPQPRQGRKTAAKAAFLVAGVCGTSKLVPFLDKPRAEHSFVGGHTMPFPYSLLPTRYSLFPIPTSYFLAFIIHEGRKTAREGCLAAPDFSPACPV